MSPCSYPPFCILLQSCNIADRHTPTACESLLCSQLHLTHIDYTSRWIGWEHDERTRRYGALVMDSSTKRGTMTNHVRTHGQPGGSLQLESIVVPPSDSLGRPSEMELRQFRRCFPARRGLSPAASSC